MHEVEVRQVNGSCSGNLSESEVNPTEVADFKHILAGSDFLDSELASGMVVTLEIEGRRISVAEAGAHIGGSDSRLGSCHGGSGVFLHLCGVEIHIVHIEHVSRSLCHCHSENLRVGEVVAVEGRQRDVDRRPLSRGSVGEICVGILFAAGELGKAETHLRHTARCGRIYIGMKIFHIGEITSAHRYGNVIALEFQHIVGAVDLNGLHRGAMLAVPLRKGSVGVAER